MSLGKNSSSPLLLYFLLPLPTAGSKMLHLLRCMKTIPPHNKITGGNFQLSTSWHQLPGVLKYQQSPWFDTAADSAKIRCKSLMSTKRRRPSELQWAIAAMDEQMDGVQIFLSFLILYPCGPCEFNIDQLENDLFPSSESPFPGVIFRFHIKLQGV